MTQHIRLSQFVTTYGPGAILETVNGPRLILMPDAGLFTPNNPSPHEFEISDPRMSQVVLNGARIYRLPTNAELGKPANYYLYRTQPFTRWKLCLHVSDHHGNHGVLHDARACPVCESPDNEPVRFVLACPDGHLSDVQWRVLVGSTGCRCNRSWFWWEGSGGSLSQIRIVCPQCKRNISLGWAYQKAWKCSGNYPERVGSQGGQCPKDARIFQRQASNLRIPELRTLFTVPPLATGLHLILSKPNVRAALQGALLANPNLFHDTEALYRVISGLEGSGIATSDLELLRTAELQKLASAWNEVQNAGAAYTGQAGIHNALLEEFIQLTDAAQRGYPPVGQRGRVYFEVNPNEVQRFPVNQLDFAVTPVRRLRTVTVQVGYRRYVGNNPQLAGVSFTDGNGITWYPGVEHLGEGIFIRLGPDSKLTVKGCSAKQWYNAWKDRHNSSDYPDYSFRSSSKEELHPVFVWWHTLSHLLIRVLAIDAGYSAAAIRERVYVKIDDATGQVDGGLVLYATQPGSEGTMGGLLALVPRFDIILQRAFDSSQSCSNDPLCANTQFVQGQCTGAACYACLFVSETSCEHRNLWLDRHVLV